MYTHWIYLIKVNQSTISGFNKIFQNYEGHPSKDLKQYLEIWLRLFFLDGIYVLHDEWVSFTHIPTVISDKMFPFCMQQFLLLVFFGMIANKAQGQSLYQTDMYLKSELLLSQFYIAELWILTKTEENTYIWSNIFYSEVLSWWKY